MQSRRLKRIGNEKDAEEIREKRDSLRKKRQVETTVREADLKASLVWIISGRADLHDR